MCIAVVAVLLVRRRRASALAVAVAVWGGGLINIGVKGLVGRARPVWDDPLAAASGQSFPSGHAMLSTIVYGGVVVLLWSRLSPTARPVVAGGAIALVMVIGFTRVALGVHWPTDVLAGFALGVMWLAASARLRDLVRAAEQPARPVA